MEVIPAIDLRSGRCVRLYQGDYRRETVYSDDPLSMALDWERQGAPRLHLVDLDGAAQGRPANLETIGQIIQRLAIPVQVGGGIRDQATAESLLAAGADRVVIGTAAVQEPSLVEGLCRKHGSGRVVVAVDARDGRVAIKGWTEGSLLSALELARRMAELGVTMVPTLVTYKAMAEMGPKVGLPERNVTKNKGVFEAGLRSIEVAKRAGVELGLGTDLLGEAQPWQNQEFAIRADLEPAADVLRSMYHVNPKLCRLEGEIGVIAPGAYADLLLTDVDPLTNLAGLADPERALKLVVRGGRVIVER